MSEKAEAVECRWCPPGCPQCEPDDCECYRHQDWPDKTSDPNWPYPTGRTFTAAEVIEIANETSDSLGNLYRIDFIDRIQYDAGVSDE